MVPGARAPAGQTREQCGPDFAVRGHRLRYDRRFGPDARVIWPAWSRWIVGLVRHIPLW